MSITGLPRTASIAELGGRGGGGGVKVKLVSYAAHPPSPPNTLVPLSLRATVTTPHLIPNTRSYACIHTRTHTVHTAHTQHT